MQDDDTICNTHYGCEDDNLSLGIRTIRSSETIISEYTTADQIESRDAPATESKPKNHLDVLFTMAQEFDSGNIHFVEDRLREAIARWENIQASRQSRQSHGGEQAMVNVESSK